MAAGLLSQGFNPANLKGLLFVFFTSFLAAHPCNFLGIFNLFFFSKKNYGSEILVKVGSLFLFSMSRKINSAYLKKKNFKKMVSP